MTLRMRPMRPMRRWGGMAAAALACGLVAAATAPSLAQQRTAKECTQEWRANKAANQAKGITEKAYVAQCRSGAAAAQPTAAPTNAPAAQQPARTPATGTATAPQRQPRRATTAAAPAGENQFTSEAQAKARCGSDQVVWVNAPTKVYHFSGSKRYGATKQGAFMCERDAQAAGDRAAKNEKHP